MNPIALLMVTIACMVSVHADTSYTPPPASGGPYPAASSPSPAPYPPSGWKPSGRQFLLPSRQTATASSYLPPKTYGPPKPTTPSVETEATTIEGTTTKPGESENLSEFIGEQQIPDSGTYYVLLPDGRLQKVTYSTMPLAETAEKLRQVENNVEKKPSGYVANVKYQDVEPINGPIYAYQNAPLVRIYK